jgi:hypothetical protein
VNGPRSPPTPKIADFLVSTSRHAAGFSRPSSGHAAGEGRTVDMKPRREEKPVTPRRRVIVVGKRQNGRWTVRMSLWRYLAATALSQ